MKINGISVVGQFALLEVYVTFPSEACQEEQAARTTCSPHPFKHGLLRSDIVSTKLHGITPQAINLALKTSTLSYHLSSSYKTFPRKKSHVLFCLSHSSHP
jgi:hypothetical protein